MTDAARIPWHASSAAEIATALGSDPARGLTTIEAATRLARLGANELEVGRTRGALRILASQFTDVMVLVLIGAATIAALVGEPQDVVVILVIVVLNAVLGFGQEYRAERAMAALRAMAAPTTLVRRDGAIVRISARELVPGDVVLLEAGNIVPADLRLTESVHLSIDESALTGESVAVRKETAALETTDLAIADRKNLGFTGTMVANGRGVGIVVATGMSTELGRVALLLSREDESRTPLQQRLTRLGKRLALVVLALCIGIFALGIARGEPPALMLMTALSLAVAAIPEALPAVVTVSLALGAHRLARQHALIRRLPAVETLGSVTFICSDKTGTLTQNRMRVVSVRVADTELERAAPELAEAHVTTRLYEALALSNDVALSRSGEPTGDPTEVALHDAAAAAGFDKAELERSSPRIAEIPFSSDRARMTTIHRSARGIVAYTKGAPERVLPSCTTREHGTGTETLDRDAASGEAHRMAAAGLRVLAIASRALDDEPRPPEDAETAQTLLGFVGLLDPPRQEARESVRMCQDAGIRVVMITGDHPETARAIAVALGIADANDRVVAGGDLAAMNEDVLAVTVETARVYARVAPEHKIRIVKALQARGQFVAMTGDGVNDAPALRRANIGVAMGLSGTDVAREAAHMVLLDDNFATIVRAVGEERRVYDNLRKFVRYVLTGNSGEIWALVAAPFFGLPLPLLPIHILWINLVTDGLPGLALAGERAERDVMRHPPRPPAESILARGLWQHVIVIGLLLGAVTLGVQAWALRTGAPWQSMAFTVLTLAQMAHVLAIRSERESLFRLGVASNRSLFGAVALTVALQMATLYVPALRAPFRTEPLTISQLTICIAAAALIFSVVELEKAIRRRSPERVVGVP